MPAVATAVAGTEPERSGGGVRLMLNWVNERNAVRLMLNWVNERNAVRLMLNRVN
jgi:hypothetical protein